MSSPYPPSIFESIGRQMAFVKLGIQLPGEAESLVPRLWGRLTGSARRRVMEPLERALSREDHFLFNRQKEQARLEEWLQELENRTYAVAPEKIERARNLISRANLDLVDAEQLRSQAVNRRLQGQEDVNRAIRNTRIGTGLIGAAGLGGAVGFNASNISKHAGIAGIALSDSATNLADKYIDITGKPVDAGEALLKSLGLTDAPHLIRKDQLPAVPSSEQGAAPVGPATPVLSKQSAMSGPPEDIKREAPEWRLPPAPHSARRHRGLLEGELQSSESDEIVRREAVPGDNEPQVGSGGGGGGSLSHAGAEVSVPDQTPQRQAMTLYDVPSSDVGNIWEHYDRRLQNPATNSIIRFVSE